MRARIFLGLFGLPFLAVGIWALFSIAGTVVEWSRVQGWEPVEARVMGGGYHTSTSGDSDTYVAYGRYEYSYGGREYTGERVALSDSPDNIGDFQRNLGKRLQRAVGEERGIEAYVNPDNPAEAIINRDLRLAVLGFKFIFLICFGGFGAIIMAAALMRQEEKNPEAPVYQQAPWLARKGWEKPEICSDAKGSMYFAWGFAIFWNAISAPLPFFLHEELLEKHNYVALIGLLFPLIGIGLLVWAVRQTVRWKKFGHVPLRMDPFPGSIGGQVGGTIDLAYPYDPAVKFLLTLSNIYSYESGSGKNRSRSERVEWQDKAVAHAALCSDGTRLTFCFDVPEGLHPSDATGRGNRYYLWRLSLEADIPGVDVGNHYDIPVYPTRQKSAFIAGHAVEISEKATQEMDNAEARSRIRFITGPQGEEMLFPMGRTFGPALVGMVVGAIFSGVAFFIMRQGGAGIFGGIFALIGVPIFLHSLYVCTNSLTVRRDGGGGIETVRCIFGLPVRTRRVRLENIQSLTKENRFSSQSGNKQTVYYAICAQLADGKKIALGEYFHGTGEADAAVALIGKTLGIKT